MNWMESISAAIAYIEDHITEDITVKEVGEHVHISPLYFQKGFSILCGYTVSEYIRNRRLTLAGRDLLRPGAKVIDIALKYGYDAPDSFTKAFFRFHCVTPAELKSSGTGLKSFAPLHIELSLKGGFMMECRIVEKPAFTVLGVSKVIPYDEGTTQCPAFWDEHYATGRGKFVCGVYGICFDEKMAGDTFKYMIADPFGAAKPVPEGYETVTIPALTWAVFPCTGPLPQTLQDVTRRAFSEWLPDNSEYQVAAGYSVEYYTDISKYPQGGKDSAYYCELWIPVKRV